MEALQPLAPYSATWKAAARHAACAASAARAAAAAAPKPADTPPRRGGRRPAAWRCARRGRPPYLEPRTWPQLAPRARRARHSPIGLLARLNARHAIVARDAIVGAPATPTAPRAPARHRRGTSVPRAAQPNFNREGIVQACASNTHAHILAICHKSHTFQDCPLSHATFWMHQRRPTFSGSTLLTSACTRGKAPDRLR